MNSASGGRDCFHLLASADRDPQMLRQAVGPHLAGQNAARLQEGESRIGVRARASSGKRGSTKLATLGVSWSPRAASRSENHGSQRSLWARARSSASTSSTAATPAASAAALTLNGLADPVQDIGDRRRAIGPAEPQPGERINLREGAQHHDVFGPVYQRDPGLVVVAVDELGIGGVDREQHEGRQARRAAEPSRGRRDRCRSGCSGWRRKRCGCVR